MGLLLLGLIFGITNGLLAAGIVLIYKSNRVINFAQGEFGAFAVAMLLALTRNQRLNYWLALTISLAATMLLAVIVERTVIQRLFSSPRLIVLVATIGVAQLIIVARLLLPKPHGFGLLTSGNLVPIPFDGPHFTLGRLHLGPVKLAAFTFGPEHVMALVAGPILIAALIAFLRWSPYGVALRASSENADRARLLGIPVRRVSLVAWILAGVVSAIAAILLAPLSGYNAGEAIGLPLLVRGLACAAVARMENVGVAFGVGLGVGVLDEVLLFNRQHAGETEAVILAVILLALLVRRRVRTRAGAGTASSWDIIEPFHPLPLEVRMQVRWRMFTGAAALVLVAAAVIVPFVSTQSTTLLLASVFLLAVVAVSITILSGWAGQLSLGQWALAGVGGVFGLHMLAEWHVNFWLGFAIAAALGGFVALLLGLPALRLEGPGLAVVTLGFAVAASAWLFNQTWFYTIGFFVTPDFPTTRWLYVLSALLLGISIVVARTLQQSRVGRNMVAARDNADQAAAFGVDVVRAKLTAFVLSGFLASSAGYLWLFVIKGSIAPGLDGTFSPVISLGLVTAVVIGGLGSISGAVLGAFYFKGIPYFLTGFYENIGLLTTGVGVLVLVMFFPGGLARILFAARDRLARIVTGIDPRRGPDAEGADAGPRASSDATEANTALVNGSSTS